jgi:hypothetical protein
VRYRNLKSGTALARVGLLHQRRNFGESDVVISSKMAKPTKYFDFLTTYDVLPYQKFVKTSVANFKNIYLI